MNIIFCIVLVFSVIYMLFTNPQIILDAFINGATKGVSLCINLLAIYAVWLGILKIAENCGAQKFLERLLKPLINLLFGKLDQETSNFIATNLSANILGLGNASTPSGIKAMENLSYGKTKCDNKINMLVLLNSLSLQIIPTTIIGLRIAAGSTNPTSIFLPIILVSYITAIISVFTLKMFSRSNKND